MSDTDSITIIGRGAHIKGEITFDTPARVLGVIEGTVYSKTELYIGETARCKAAVHAAVVLVDGEVEGSLMASERIELSAKCCVKGDITTGSLVVADGASFMGFCRVGPGALEAATTRDQAPASLQITHEQAPRTQERSHQLANGSLNSTLAPNGQAGNMRTTTERPTADRIVIPDKAGVEVKNQPAHTPGHATTNGTAHGTTHGTTQPRPRARTADWLPPATPAFPSVVTKTTDWNGSAASAL